LQLRAARHLSIPSGQNGCRNGFHHADRDEKLAQLQSRFDTVSGVLGIAESGRVLPRALLTEQEGAGGETAVGDALLRGICLV
jgi:hypothetical protein